MSQQINLFNPLLGPQRAIVSARNLAMATVAAICFIGLLGSLLESRRSAHRIEASQAAEQLKVIQDRMQQLVQQSSNAKPDPALQKEVDRMASLIDSRSIILAVLGQGSAASGMSYAEILRGLARQVVSGLWLTDIRLTANSGTMELKGRTTDRALVAEYLNRLNAETVFSGRSFAGLRLEVPRAEDGSVKGLPYLEFALSGNQESAAANSPSGGQSGADGKNSSESKGNKS
jgi:Tfp pilus assembly protein PilN